MNTARNTAPAIVGIQSLAFTREERQLPVFKKIVAALREQDALMLAQLRHPSNIEQTTLARGGLSLLSQILARTDEVGPESRQSEADGPEFAYPARTATGFPQGF